MIVEPDFVDGPKLLALKERLGRKHGAEAAEYLLRLWAHCQAGKRGQNWGPVSASYVELVARWRGPRGELFAALTTVLVPGRQPLIVLADHGTGTPDVVIHDWEDHNRSLIQKWKANPNGRRGNRPPIGEESSDSQPTGQPTNRLRIEVASDRTGQDKTGQERTGGGKARAGTDTADPSTPPPPPIFLPLDPKLFQRELRVMLETAKLELSRLPERAELTERRLSPEVADLVALLEREGNADRARAVTEDRLNWRPVLSDVGKRHQAAWKQRITALEAALKGVVA